MRLCFALVVPVYVLALASGCGGSGGTFGPSPTSNSDPVAAADVANTSEGAAVEIAVLANDSDADGDALTLESVTQAVSGSVSVNPLGTVTYTPAPGFTGLDTFTYVISDGRDGSDSATVTVAVNAPGNNPPTANDDSATTDEDAAVAINVLANDTDPDAGDVPTVWSVTEPTRGTAALNADNTVTYIPNVGFSGTDSFTYVVSDGRGGAAVATVTITVNEVYDPKILYVDLDVLEDPPPPTWPGAVGYLEVALHAALPGDEVWVAEGTYVPGTAQGDPVREDTFQLAEGVAVYGGFAGGETRREDRDWTQHETILCGDINGDDDGRMNMGDNTYHVVTGANGARIDGFTIAQGYSNEDGAGLLLHRADTNVANCTFTKNVAARYGGGVSCRECTPTIVGCVFELNYANEGAAIACIAADATISDCVFGENGGKASEIYVDAGSPTITRCYFHRFGVLYSGASTLDDTGILSVDSTPRVVNCDFSRADIPYQQWGLVNIRSDATVTGCRFVQAKVKNEYCSPLITGCEFRNPYCGIYNTESSPTVSDCTFVGVGAGVRDYSNSTSLVTGCVFTDCETGVYSTEASAPIVEYCEFVDGTYIGASPRGPGSYVQVYEASAIVRNCTFSNYVGGGFTVGAGIGAVRSTVDVSGCTLEGNDIYGSGGGMWCGASSDVTVTDCVFSSNTAQYAGGIGLWSCHALIENCRFAGNEAYGQEAGGAMVVTQGATGVIRNCEFIGNKVNGGNGMGGALMIWEGVSDQLTVINCVFRENQAVSGGAIFCRYDASPTITNCVFVRNTASSYGGAFNVEGNSTNTPSPTVGNCTFWGNESRYSGGAFRVGPDAEVTLSNCVLWGNSCLEGTPGETDISVHTVRGGVATVSYSCIQDGFAGTGNISADPLFVDTSDFDGPDDILGTADDGLRLDAGSPCIDAGDNTGVPADVSDLDGDGDTAEAVPMDITGGARFVDDPATADSGNGSAPLVDMGAYEFR